MCKNWGYAVLAEHAWNESIDEMKHADQLIERILFLEGVPNVFASPVAARGRIYFPGQDGGTVVIKSGPAFEVLATNTLDDAFDASPALVDNEMFLRGRTFLYAIAE